MDYKEKYEQALSKAKDMLNYKEVRREDMEYLFPELAKSEDEKVRKALIDFFSNGAKYGGHTNGVYDKDILAWLEKQGQVKKSFISQHENRTCEENGNSLTYEGERIRAEENKGNIGGISANWSEEDEMVRKDLIGFFKDEAFLCHKKKQIIAWLKKQGDSPIKWNKNTKDCKPQKNHSVLMKTTHGIAEGEWQGEKWFQYRWSSSIKDSDVLFWIELSDIEKQGETFPVLSNSSNSGKNEQKPAEWSEEDEKMFNFCCEYLDDTQEDWLKSLRPQNRWKPSELQLGCLSDAIKHYNSLGYPASKLKKLLDDLKKLNGGEI